MCIYIDFLFFFTFLEVLEILRICPLLHGLTKFSHLCSGIYLINFRSLFLKFYNYYYKLYKKDLDQLFMAIFMLFTLISKT